jgi:hypothetical protein
MSNQAYTPKQLEDIRYMRTVDKITAQLAKARKEGAPCVYFDALATADDTTTLGDLVDQLTKMTRIKVQFEGGRIVGGEIVK